MLDFCRIFIAILYWQSVRKRLRLMGKQQLGICCEVMIKSTGILLAYY